MKSQMELFGVAMLAVVLTLGFFIYIGVSSRQSNEIKETYTSTKLAQNMLNVMLETKTSCGIPLTEILKDCYGSNSLCYGDSCEYAKEFINNTFEVTLRKWNMPHLLTVKQGTSEKIRVQYLGCDDTKEKEAPGIQPIPSMPPIIIRLDLCK